MISHSSIKINGHYIFITTNDNPAKAPQSPDYYRERRRSMMLSSKNLKFFKGAGQK